MESPQKRTRPTWLLWVLVAILVLILLTSAGMAYVFLRSKESPSVNATSIPLVDPAILPTQGISSTSTKSTTGTTAGQTTTEEDTTTSSSTSTSTSTSTGTSSSSSTSTTTVSTSEAPTISPTTEANKELLSSCSAIVAARVSCARTLSDVTATSPDWFSPILYKLNLTVSEPLPKRNVDIRGALQIFFTMNKDGKQISLNAAQSLRGLDDVTVVDCESGKTLCVSKAVSEGDVLSLILDDAITAGTVLRLEFPQFASALPKEVTYQKTYIRKIGQKMIRQLMVGSRLKKSGARALFPAFDSSQSTARLSLCVNHWSKSEVRSNSPADFSSEQTCFRPSHPITADQFAFAATEGTELLLNNGTIVNGQQIPTIEMLIDATQKNKTEKHKSIQQHAESVISQMSSWVQFPYPQEKLTLIYAPIAVDYLSSLGMITLPDPAFEYSYHNKYHESLTRALVSQWTDGALSTDDCLQSALTTYLGWKLDETLGYHDRDMKKEIAAIRDLSNEDGRSARFIRDLTANDCSPRDLVIFHTLDKTYGSDVVTGMLKEALQKKAFSYVSLDDWKDAVVTATGNEMAGAMLQEWFSRKNYPMMKATIHSQQIDIQQLTTNPWRMAMEFAGSKGKYTVELNQLQQAVPFASDDYVVIDPDRKSAAFVVYDADGYSRLKRCWDSRTCPASQENLKSIFRDFGAVLRSNTLEPMEERDKAKWRDFLQFARPHMEVKARCCVSYILNQAAPEQDCYWSTEECKKLRFGRI